MFFFQWVITNKLETAATISLFTKVLSFKNWKSVSSSYCPRVVQIACALNKDQYCCDAKRINGKILWLHRILYSNIPYTARAEKQEKYLMFLTNYLSCPHEVPASTCWWPHLKKTSSLSLQSSCFNLSKSVQSNHKILTFSKYIYF